MKKTLVIIDGNSLVNRAFYALPDLMNKNGLHTNAIYGFTNMLFKILNEYKPEYISVAFDKKAPTFRHIEYKEYKLGRKKMPSELLEQIEPLKELLDALKIHRLEIEGFEADDIIGTISKIGEEKGLKVIIVTGDKDAIQLASENTTVLITKKGLTDLESYDYDEVLKKYELTPKQFIDLKGLMGDKSDNIPGVAGIGEKTGIKLLKEFESIENILQNTEKLSKSIKTKIEQHFQDAIMSKKLATIVRDIPLDIDIQDLKVCEYDTKKVLDLFNEYGFNSLISKLKPQEESKDTNLNLLSIDENIDELINKIKKEKYFALKTVKKDSNLIDKNIIYLFITLDGENIYYTNQEATILKMKEIFTSDDIKKYGYDLKQDYINLRPYEIEMSNLNFDIKIAEYLIDTTNSNYTHDQISAKYLGKKIQSEEELLGKGKNIKKYEQIDEDLLKKYFADILNLVINVRQPMEEKIYNYNMDKLFFEVEMPLVQVLGSMEYEGFKIDIQKLKELDDEYTKIIQKLENDIYDLASEKFNINSPKQLGIILFEKLNLPVIKKTKTGYSTDSEVLESLKKYHPIIEKISEYRQITKLKTTYVDGLLNIVNTKTGRIHSSFNQTITSTGRISSTEPNLQNIPIRLELGRNLRKVFISEEGYKLLDADYSQIELRVLAHISEDDNLIDAFLKGEDIHTMTASKVFNIEIDKVTRQMRDAAKAVNFGIVYGISDFGLSQNLNISVKKAKEYIDSYFEKYSKVKEYMDNIIQKSKKDGYVTTILNRRRYIPEINSKNFVVQNLGKRLAMNTPIQGSAADIIKVAMVNVYRRLKENNLKSKLILQVHDELIVEVLEDEIEKVTTILKEEMMNALELKVPLSIDLNLGKSWYDTK
ncbi:DNA polymerase I [Alkalithermobacter thermoalcaliphilus JW-YL-7 = DSM 7308]|uniref:DNA polymerase I n=1 Tax=Alkalithermobacter thermoalcaliphilus JW-YL-7 = DSM 7308 TaxID=1121328 RepID=A0A150FRE1_CLOPD|nr:DNA polymerase I [[Clostridium] paradoxum JW-YL-7 = DSM 7308]SHK43712.1 DNA polymerase I [[Clostridium] paradoxum JW-YL-7 = DSM 7308]